MLSFFREIKAGTLSVNTRNFQGATKEGIKNWIYQIRKLNSKTEIHFFECSAAFIEIVNKNSEFIPISTIRSAHLMFLCRQCHNKEPFTIKSNDVTSIFDISKKVFCTCDNIMEIWHEHDELLSVLNNMISTTGIIDVSQTTKASFRSKE